MKQERPEAQGQVLAPRRAGGGRQSSDETPHPAPRGGAKLKAGNTRAGDAARPAHAHTARGSAHGVLFTLEINLQVSHKVRRTPTCNSTS